MPHEEGKKRPYGYKETREMTESSKAMRTGRYSGGTEAAAGERTPRETIGELGKAAADLDVGGNIITRPFRRAAAEQAKKEALAVRGKEYGVGKRLPWQTPHEKMSMQGVSARKRSEEGY